MDNPNQPDPDQPQTPAPVAPQPAHPEPVINPAPEAPLAPPTPVATEPKPAPAPEPSVATAQPSITTAEPATAPDGQKTILIVEDDPLLVKMYTTKFTKEGFNVINAQDGEEGYNTAMSNKVDFMILDVMMPKMSGIDLLTKLRADVKYKDTPVIVLTNLTQKEEAVKVQTLNVKEYLVKANFTPSEVVAKVKQYLA